MKCRSLNIGRDFLNRSLLSMAFAAGSFSIGGTLSAAEAVAEKKPTDKTSTATTEKPAAETKSEFPLLAEKISSFGAVRAGDWVYVYSGHTGGAHKHSKKNLSLHFQRLNLAAPKAWEDLPAGPGLQSVALVAYGDSIYRVGGMSARNEPGAPDDLVSVTDFFRFDPVAKSWTPLQPLPMGRSSHDAIVVGSKLYVVGGWNLTGSDHEWQKKSLVLDLAAKDAKWQELPEQPFERRAIAVAELNGKIYALGGMNSDDEPSNDVHYFDTATNAWSAGPTLPGNKMSGFGTSAITVDGKLYASGMEGGVYRLSEDGKSWDSIGNLNQPRFFHRFVNGGDRSLLAIAGASKKGHLDSIERFSVSGNAK
ncbi:MAG: hypothetical protein K8U03_25730 [Planctomycetia bacterium]|nr:hypothetical protein [Planctomycetia bacterium]